jgi:hypothetical protein
MVEPKRKMIMKKLYKIAFVSALGLLSASSFAGNPERSGTGGATELLINPWARSSGFGGINSSMARGVEAMNLNVGGLAFTKKTEVIFSRTQWLSGTDININAFGFSQRVGASGVLGVSITSMDFGDIDVTTNDRPEGGVGEFSPQLLNFALAYSREFSNSIRGGVAVRGITHAIADIRSQGFALDAGIQYSTGDLDQFKMGIALRNIGPDMRMGGDGLIANFTDPSLPFAVEGYRKSQAYALPALLNLGLSYDFYLGKDHRVTALGNFTSNSFSGDQLGVGLEYGFKKYFMLRGGFNNQENITDAELSQTVYRGYSAGATFEIPINDKGSTIGIDYSYTPSFVFNGTHSFGARITL